MEDNEFLEILKDTYLNYGEKQIYKALYKALKEQDYSFFSQSKYSVRELLKNQMSELGIKDLNNMFLINIVNIYVDSINRKENAENKLDEIILSCGNKAKNTLYNIVKQKLTPITTRLSGTNVEKTIEEYEETLEVETLLDKILQLMYEQFIKEIKNSYKLSGLKQQIAVKNFSSITAKNCAILSGIKDKNVRQVEKNTDKQHLNAVSSIGNLRAEQQDAAIIMTHPENKKIKLLAVCDGMGGMDNGAFASHILVNKFGKWFISRGKELFKCKDEELKEIINIELHMLNDLAKRELEKKTSPDSQSGSTLVAAIIYKGEAIIINVGDSRAYAIKGGQFRQITKDQSYSQMLYDNLYSYDEPYSQVTRDDMRFHDKNNISAPAFFTKYNFEADVTRLHKGDFDSIILCSDGITDCLCNEEIAYISTNVKQNEIAKYLVVAANSRVTPIPDRLEGLLGMTRQIIRPGKDNSTVATYGGDER